MTGRGKNTHPIRRTRWRRFLQTEEASLIVEERERQTATSSIEQQRQAALERS